MKLLRITASFVLPILAACAAQTNTGSAGPGGSGGTGGTGPGPSSSSSSSSSSGQPGTCTTAADCKIDPSMPNHECLQPACINGVCGGLPTNELGACEDGKQCTQNDTCQNGVCTGGTTKFCPSDDSCHVGACDTTLDTCIQVPGNDGASCVDDDACTLPGNCSQGTCIPGGQVDCSFLDGTCSVGFCDPQIGCKVMPQADGAACDDNLYCTVQDKCQNGQCVGVPNNCAQPGNICMIGQCNEAQHTCVAVPGNNGVMCDDGNDCTTGSTCSNGNCVGGVPANNGMMCDDGNGCTLGTTCSNGVCGNPQNMVQQCINGDGCCPAGCQMNDSDCSITKWSEGTNAWPDEACNPNNSFGNCDTNAQNHADAWATAVCQMNGYSTGVWTGNKAPGCTGNVSMYCGGQIPCNKIFEFMCFASDQTKIEFTCFP